MTAVKSLIGWFNSQISGQDAVYNGLKICIQGYSEIVYVWKNGKMNVLQTVQMING